jgi:hypothetical protein
MTGLTRLLFTAVILFPSDYAHSFPRPLRSFSYRLIAANDAVVLVGLTHGAERFVIETWKAERIFQFFSELLQHLQMVCGSGDFGLRSLQHLLVAAVDELGDFSADQITGVGKYFHALIAVFLNGCRHVVLLKEDAALRTGRFDQIKAMIAQPLDGVFESAFF